MKIVLLGVLLINAVAFRVLPDVTFFASNRMCAIVEVLAVLAAHCAIEDPLILLFGKCVQLFLPSLHLSLEVTL